MIFFKNTGIKISRELQQLAKQEYQEAVSNSAVQKSMDYLAEKPRMMPMIENSPYREEFLAMRNTQICNLQGYKPSQEFEQRVRDELTFLKSLTVPHWIRLQRVSGGTWFPYHSDEVKTTGLVIGIDHHEEQTKFWTEINPTEFVLKARSNLKFEQQAVIGNREVYVFNHHEVHSVHNCDPAHSRVSLTVSFDGITVDQLLDICETQRNQ